jgi:hypothetical protein
LLWRVEPHADFALDNQEAIMHEAETRPMSESLSEGAASFKDKAASKARQAAGQARSAADDGKQRLASRIDDVAQAFHRTGEQLRSEQQDSLSQLTDGIGAQIDRVAAYLQQRDVRSLASEVEHFARRQPALFMGGAFTLGLLAARFLKSSGEGATYDEPSNWRDDPIGGSMASDYASPEPLPSDYASREWGGT